MSHQCFKSIYQEVCIKVSSAEKMLSFVVMDDGSVAEGRGGVCLIEPAKLCM